MQFFCIKLSEIYYDLPSSLNIYMLGTIYVSVGHQRAFRLPDSTVRGTAIQTTSYLDLDHKQHFVRYESFLQPWRKNNEEARCFGCSCHW